MHQTIIKQDNAVYINYVAKTVDCSALPMDFHALQWDSDLNTGWIEKINIDGTVTNEPINNIDAYQWYFDQWNLPNPPLSPPTAEENATIAGNLLLETDWVNQPDVIDPLATPHLLNRDEFLTYRSQVRQYAVYPVAGFITWPTKPTAVWS